MMATETETETRPTFKFKVFSPFRVFFEGKVISVSAENKTGPFDILQGHANFLTLLVPCVTTVETPTGFLKFQVDGGVMQVTDDKVTLFLNV